MPPTPEDPVEYFRQWLTDGGASGDPGASYFHVERSYWAARADANMLLVHYADLKADCAGEIARIACLRRLEMSRFLPDRNVRVSVGVGGGLARSPRVAQSLAAAR